MRRLSTNTTLLPADRLAWSRRTLNIDSPYPPLGPPLDAWLPGTIILFTATAIAIRCLRLGRLFARSGKLAVCCPEGYWKKGNVDVVCAIFRVPTAPSLEELLTHVRQ